MVQKATLWLFFASSFVPATPAGAFITGVRGVSFQSRDGGVSAEAGGLSATGWVQDVALATTLPQCRGRLRRRRNRTGSLVRMAGGPSEGGDVSEGRQQRDSSKVAVHRVIFMRHGECEWNRDNRFLGWADIGLTENGEIEARRAARTLAEFGIEVDEVFCSYLKRSIKSAWLLADELDQSWMPIHTDWRLNEQMYGALQGLNKRATAERYGTELTQAWRRSYDNAPPAVPGGSGYFPVGDVKYAGLAEDDIPSSWCGSPNTESLKDAQARSWVFWRERMVPRMKAGKTVLICGHGNIIRSMLKRLDSIPKDVLKQVSIPRATPIVYDLDEDLSPVRSPNTLAPLSGRFLGNPLELAAALERESLQAQLGPKEGVGVGTAVTHVPDAGDRKAVPETASPAAVGSGEGRPGSVL